MRIRCECGVEQAFLTEGPSSRLRAPAGIKPRMAESPVDRYEGEQADVTWDRRLCIHMAECGRAKQGLFVGGREPWCKPDVVGLDVVRDVVSRCPSGALAIEPKDPSAGESAERENTITVSAHGPYYVRGELAIDGASADMRAVRFRAALCRCGATRNAPFCDGAHDKSGFRDHGAIGERGPGSEGTGELVIERATNGPLLVRGPFAMRSASGRVAFRGEKAALCRCGHSNNKPFCDGSHKSVGFEAD
jgi:CDGSH-type Zn-finger protein/uncharacterized Fe-S cluster protein YjdI